MLIGDACNNANHGGKQTWRLYYRSRRVAPGRAIARGCAACAESHWAAPCLIWSYRVKHCLQTWFALPWLAFYKYICCIWFAFWFVDS